MEEHLPGGAEAELDLKEGEQTLLELVSLETQSFAVTSGEDHAQELLTSNYQVRQADLSPMQSQGEAPSWKVRPGAKEPVL